MVVETQKFPLGRTVITRNALSTLHADDVAVAVRRHASGDWGECCEEDRKENELALEQELRILSVYRDRNDVKFWIITEADRSATTVLLPEDYYYKLIGAGPAAGAILNGLEHETILHQKSRES
jgi:hypothetical protein